jgi:hypothetical protein
MRNPSKIIYYRNGSIQIENYIVCNESYTILCGNDESVHVLKNGQEGVKSINGFMRPTHCYLYEERLYVIDSTPLYSKICVVDMESYNILFSFGDSETVTYQGIVVKDDIIYLFSTLKSNRNYYTGSCLHMCTLNGHITKTVNVTEFIPNPLGKDRFNFYLFQNKLTIITGGRFLVNFFALNLEYHQVFCLQSNV